MYNLLVIYLLKFPRKSMKEKNIFISGPIGAGKSTAINEALKLLNVKSGGFITKPLIYNKSLKGFKIIDLLTNAEAEIARFDEKYLIHPLIDGFENLGVKAIENALKENCEIVIMDELGFLEDRAEKFQEAVFKALLSKKPVIGAMKNEKTQFLNKVSKLATVIKITNKNRSTIPERLRRTIWDYMKI